jgi:hypothetical protein
VLRQVGQLAPAALEALQSRAFITNVDPDHLDHARLGGASGRPSSPFARAAASERVVISVMTPEPSQI